MNCPPLSLVYPVYPRGRRQTKQWQIVSISPPVCTFAPFFLHCMPLPLLRQFWYHNHSSNQCRLCLIQWKYTLRDNVDCRQESSATSTSIPQYSIWHQITWSEYSGENVKNATKLRVVIYKIANGEGARFFSERASSATKSLWTSLVLQFSLGDPLTALSFPPPPHTYRVALKDCLHDVRLYFF